MLPLLSSLRKFDFQSFVPGTGREKPKYIVLIISHNITFTQYRSNEVFSTTLEFENAQLEKKEKLLFLKSLL